MLTMSKKTTKPVHASEVRQGEFSAAEILKGAQALERLAGALKGSAKSMDLAGLGVVSLDGATKLRRGLELINAFSQNLQRSISREDLGGFGT